MKTVKYVDFSSQYHLDTYYLCWILKQKFNIKIIKNWIPDILIYSWFWNEHKSKKYINCKKIFWSAENLFYDRRFTINSFVNIFKRYIPQKIFIKFKNILWYKILNIKEPPIKTYKLDLNTSNKVNNEILRLAKSGAYSEVERLIATLQDSPSKEFLSSSLKKVDFDSIIKSIVSS